MSDHSTSGPSRKTKRSQLRKRRAIIGASIAVVLIIALVGGSYVYVQWRFNAIPKITVKHELPQLSGKPFNILEIGSDSRAGLTGSVAAQAGSVSGERSDVVKIMHIDPAKNSISVLSIPRDTVISIIDNQALHGNFNRINVNYGDGASAVAAAITANFGIPINHVIEVSFGGLINSVVAIGGVYLNFPYPARDAYSGLRITNSGCQLVTGAQALAVARSRHYEYFQNGQWLYDGTSDYGRIYRQNIFIKAMINQVKNIYNPLKLNSLISSIPAGITLDSNFTLNNLVSLAIKFHKFNSSAMKSYTLPVAGMVNPNLGDVLIVKQPDAQALLLSIFGNTLLTPTNPPPNSLFVSTPPPVVTTTTTTTTTTIPSKHKNHSTTTSTSTTTTTDPSQVMPYFDPVPCSLK